MTIDLDELRRLLAEATPGPWGIGRSSTCQRQLWNVWAVETQCDITDPCAHLSEPDARLIAAAVNALPALLDRLEAAEQDRDDARSGWESAAETVREMEQDLEAAQSRLYDNGMTHSAECWRWHLGCAVKRLESDEALCTNHRAEAAESERDSLRAEVERLRCKEAGRSSEWNTMNTSAASANLRAEAAEAESEQLRERVRVLSERLSDLADAYHGAWMDHGYDAETLGDEYNAARAALAADQEGAGGGS